MNEKAARVNDTHLTRITTITTQPKRKFSSLNFLRFFKSSLNIDKNRLQKELSSLSTDPPDGIHIDQNTFSDDLSNWIVELNGPGGTLYEGEKFRLNFKFTSKYPFDSPQVIFVGDCIPIHPHIYSNGHICLSILFEDWSPALSVQGVCLSIISMLASAKEKKRPPDDDQYVKRCSQNPKNSRWWFHDDDV